jgi:hypothetical protein
MLGTDSLRSIPSFPPRRLGYADSRGEWTAGRTPQSVTATRSARPQHHGENNHGENTKRKRTDRCWPEELESLYVLLFIVFLSSHLPPDCAASRSHRTNQRNQTSIGFQNGVTGLDRRSSPLYDMKPRTWPGCRRRCARLRWTRISLSLPTSAPILFSPSSCPFCSGPDIRRWDAGECFVSASDRAGIAN